MKAAVLASDELEFGLGWCWSHGSFVTVVPAKWGLLLLPVLEA